MSLRQLARSLALRIPAVQRIVSDRDALLSETLSLRQRVTVLEREAARNDASILDVYVTDPPSRRAALAIFEGAWSSKIPGYGFGHTPLFDDERVRWFEERCGGVKGKRILELGPLEGGHTYMLAKAGAASITSIESSRAAFLKCLAVQNVLKFEADFILGDFRPFLATCTDTYDLLVASGVLYHMTEPVKLLQDMAKVARAIGIWTHYYDADVILGRADLAKHFEPEPRVQRVGGRDVVSYKQSYLKALQWKGFCGGPAPISYWLTRDGLLGVLEDLGLQVEISADHKGHPNGPCMTLFASR
jgi:SAM-dependent methyltransferase